MAEKTRRHGSRRAAVSAVGVGVIGAVTASFGIAAPAYATDYPSWNDVQQAKANVAKQQAMISQITTLIEGLQKAADEAGRQSMMADEAYLEAKAALESATQKAADLEKQAQAAAEKAKTSQMRAGLLASHLARSGGQNLSVDLLIKGGEGKSADNLLYQLGTMSKLTQQSQRIYAEAESDRNNAESLTAQAEAAQKERQQRADAASAALEKAHAAEAASRAAVATEQEKSTELISQLATLKNTSVEVEAGYLKGEAERKAAAAAAAAAAAERRRQAEAAAAAAAAAANHGGGGGSAAPSAPSAPNGSQVERAIWYAEQQLGEPYVLGGEGPSVWDCSGLTMMAYRYAGVNIGGHYVPSQYATMQRQGRLVPYSQRQRGDLLFWSSGGGAYHIAIYLGGGMMIAAPKAGDVVKIQPVWGYGGDLMGVVGRPTG
ncbi:C40 family peptidase [Microbacterium sp. STN6]|uniref:C40 family peptidase n=1 Tax=Microbacterium sp. STN6 TaxID=2995588 RepID=UPI002260B802|nr:C40 family peptidase [Microbacterium sp. STN6]MCX7523053.1 C40 family peptidase [Microbacterium sp. STN6]